MSTEPTSEVPAGETTNPLVNMSIRGIRNWTEWKKLFFERVLPPDQPGQTAGWHLREDLTGLLFEGFAVRADEADQADRICTYLDLANGYQSCAEPKSHLFAVAQKAWKVLVLNCFRDPEDSASMFTHYGPWVRAICREEVFRKLLWFFEWSVNVPSTTFNSSRENKIALNFLREFTRHTLTFRYYRDMSEAALAVQKMFRAERRRIFRLMAHLHDLPFILKSADVELDTTDLQILEEMALAQPAYRRRQTGHCSSVEEAYSCGSDAAAVALLLRVRLNQAALEEARQKAEAEREVAERRLELINQAEARRARAEQEIARLSGSGEYSSE